MAITPVGRVRILLPGGKEFVAVSGIHDINMSTTLSENGDVSAIDISSQPQSTDSAYRLAMRWAKAWHLPAAPIDEWYRFRQLGRAEGHEDLSTSAEFGGAQLEGRDAPIPGLTLAYSFEDDRPSIVEFNLFWPGEEARSVGTPIPSF